MSEYKRFISYIYAYPGNVKDKNVGFAKVELRNGQCRLDMTLNGVHMDASKLYGVYLMVKDKGAAGGCLLIFLGEVLVRGGQGKYRDILNPENMNGSGYTMSDGIGIAVTDKEDSYYRMFSLWNDDVFRPENVHYPEPEKPEELEELEEPQELQPEESQQPQEIQEVELVEEKEPQEVAQPEVEAAEIKEMVDVNVADDTIDDVRENSLQWLIDNGDLIDAFEDDDMYDCVEVSPEQVKNAVGDNEVIDSNSFMMHGFYRFHHLLLGRVQENDNNTRYFIGIPGMYCNRERYMASVFGFGNFKKSHRSDYTNPYFGYWYQEI